MKQRVLMSALAALAAIVLSGCASEPAAQQSNIQPPHLEKRGNVTQLIVNGEPYLALAGELAGSSATSGIYMAEYWDAIKEAGFNTLLATVYWEQIEPEEGKFDFTRVDDMIKNARERDMKLVFLWFASWKNGVTSHIPLWMKENCEKYQLAQTKEGKPISILTTFCQANWEADAKAFAALSNHIEEVDAEEQTVIMIQIENEMGLHGHTRDYHPAAVEAFNAPVPQKLIDYLVANKDNLIPETKDAWMKAGGKTEGNWEEIFGKGDYTDELFMAWHYASYIEHVASAGKEAYPLPYFVNAWLVQPEDKHPGNYPSGGPQAQNHEMWRAAAPHVDILSPDIYLADFPGILKRYMRGGNPGFIPESKAGHPGAANAAFAFGEMGAIGYSPMGIERQLAREDFKPISWFYYAVENMSDKILQHQADGTIRGIWLKEADGPNSTNKVGDYSPVITQQEIVMGNFKIIVTLNTPRRMRDAPLPQGYAMVMQDGEKDFTILGSNVNVTFLPADGEGFVGLGRSVEGTYNDNGEWVPSRWLNGDDVQLRYDILQAIDEGFSSQGLYFNGAQPQIVKVRLYNYN
ncbi:MAG: DUF5597 domain-containing protein [Tidjanibacter sp.]|nr:DUF5597 domain-containing protein [Tidjanibacter sp.]